MKRKYLLLSVVLFCALGLMIVPVRGDTDSGSNTCAVYFTGVGCPHCAKADPVVLKDMITKHPEFVVVEYEIYQLRENAPLLQQYNSRYGTNMGVPLLIFGEGNTLSGDRPIMNNVDDKIKNMGDNPCLTLDEKTSFNELDITELPRKPKIWKGDRILIKEGGGKIIEKTDPVPVALSGSKVRFENAAIVGGWRFQWNGEGIEEINISCDEGEKLVPNSEGLRRLLTSEDIQKSLQNINYDCVAENATDGNNGGGNGGGNQSSISSMASISIIIVIAIIVILILWGLKR